MAQLQRRRRVAAAVNRYNQPMKIKLNARNNEWRNVAGNVCREKQLNVAVENVAREISIGIWRRNQNVAAMTWRRRRREEKLGKPRK